MSRMTPEECSRVIQEYSDAIKTAAGASEELVKQFKIASKQTTDDAYDLSKGINQLTKTSLDFFGKMSDGAQGARQMTGVLKSGGDIVSGLLSNFGILGKLLGKLIDVAVSAATKSAEQGDKLYETFQQFGKFGATSKDGVEGIYRNMQKFGYGIEQLGEMTSLLSQNSATLAKLGGSVTQGVDTLAGISDTIIHSEIGEKLLRMGKTIDSINRYTMDYSRQQVMMGNDRRDQLAFMTQQTADYAFEMEALARLTGMTMEQQQEAINAAFADEAFNQQMAEWNKMAADGDADADRQINKWREIMASNLPKATKQELARAMAGDYGAAQKSILAMPDAVKLARDKNADAADVINRARDQLKDTRETMGALAKYHRFGDTFGDFKEAGEFVASIGDMDYRQLKATAKEQQVVKDSATNAQTKLRIAQMNSRDVMQNLINYGVAPVTEAFTTLAQSSAWLSKVPGAYVPKLGSKASAGIGGASGPGGGTGAMGTSVKASGPNAISGIVETGAGYLVVKRPDGSVERLEGTRNWRNNNPGNIEYGAFAKSMGAIGSDGRFAIFPSYEAGRNAKEKLIFEGKRYSGLTLSQAIAKYAPPSENNTGNYQRAVLSAVGGVDKPMGAYTPQERIAIMDAMQKVEGFRVGKVTSVSGATTVAGVVAGLTGDKSGLAGKSTSGVDSNLVNALAAAAAEYKKITGKDVTVTSAVRSPEEQARLYNDYLAGRSRYPVAKPGHSKHDRGLAIDVNSVEANELDRMGLLRKYGLARPVANDPVHIELAKFAKGGISSGPTDGYEVLLHGTEAVVPLGDGNSIKVQTPRHYTDVAQRTGAFAKSLDRLAEAVELFRDNNQLVEKIRHYTKE